jgi:antitoxin PrlF
MSSKISTTVSPRGQITLPASLREKLGLEGGSTVTLEEQDGIIVLRPAAVVEFEIYTDNRLKAFAKADKLDDGLRESLEGLRPKRSPRTASRG